MSDITQTHQPPTTLGSWILLVAQAIDSYGLDSNSLFKENGIELTDIKRNDTRYPTGLMSHVWQLAVERTQDPYLAIRVARFFKPSAYGALGLTMAASATVHDALSRFSRYCAMINDGTQVNLAENDNDLCLTLNPYLESKRQSSIYGVSATLCCLYNLLKEVAGEGLLVKEVHFEQYLSSTSKFEHFFSCPVIYGSNSNKIVFNKHQVHTKQHFYHAEFICALDGWIEQQLRKIKQEMTSSKVKNILFKHINGGEFTQQNIASSLAMSTRKLQRKLSDEGTTYTELLNDYRKNLAIKLIIKDTMPLSEVSCLLGFNNQSNFTRAFKRWTGTTPNQYPL